MNGKPIIIHIFNNSGCSCSTKIFLFVYRRNGKYFLTSVELLPKNILAQWKLAKNLVPIYYPTSVLRTANNSYLFI